MRVSDRRLLERHESDETENLVEPTELFQEDYSLRMAATLVDINKSYTFPTVMSIKQDVVIRQAVPIEGNLR